MIDTSVSQETVNAVMQRLDALAAKLGVTAQYIYGVYVQQARVEAIRDTIAASLFLVSTLVSGYTVYRLFRRGMREDNCDDYPWVLAGIGTVVVIILFVMAMSGFYTALGEWLNPQFWALDALFKAIR
jgi:hypothetical protein